MNRFYPHLIILNLANFFTSHVAAVENDIEIIEITTHSAHRSLTADLEERLTAEGVNFSAAGGVSSLPVVHGLMGDRVQVLVDGAASAAACGNQMNPPLSYVSANQVKGLSVLPGVSKVSAGGDNIAGVIEVNTFAPRFSESPDIQWAGGNVSYHHSSNGNGQNIDVNASGASNTWYVSYTGNRNKAQSFKNGNGERVLDTLFKAQNHIAAISYRDDNQRIDVKLTHQEIPYQGFPNQYMDMTDNNSTGFLAHYEKELRESMLEAHASWHDIEHEMGFFTAEKSGVMPMDTAGQDVTLKLKWSLPLNSGATLIVGQGYFSTTLDDRWPAVAGTMMGPDDYVNINNGKRQRIAAYAEWTQPEKEGWRYSAGARVERVTTDTGEVQAYSSEQMSGMSMMNADSEAAMVFNQQDRSQADIVIDATLLAERTFEEQHKIEMGITRKNRAPNLYERYSWGRGIMATTMIGWYGDGNGYVGNIDLKPETALTASAKYSYDATKWTASANVWYTDLQDYIDVEVLDSFNSTSTSAGNRNILQITNLDASLLGATLSTTARLAENSTGKWLLSNVLQWQKDERKNSEDDLYQIIPLENVMTLSHEKNNWQTRLEWRWIDSKNNIDIRRLENETNAYSLLNIATQLSWQNIAIEVAVNNMLDEYFQQPLGGVNVAANKANSTLGFPQLDGRGRSVDIGISYRF
ncbi:TonB-dependent receptor [Alteromonas pelagimontana]|uniref:TonB-dependent receptor n=1 Tax=Alteromonas pelagimontana TaxID=1858656 RepID=A0A6M4MHJ7_9ALTE|nr:TonB-dependent receptor [Alteromonas pelagimontana]QJR81656.1 TonB-dependent receptor [Alteromonas pelagimontana]